MSTHHQYDKEAIVGREVLQTTYEAYDPYNIDQPAVKITAADVVSCLDRGLAVSLIRHLRPLAHSCESS